ncbi:hypothetical protein ACQP0C_09755 [Nocardia sp. CA-129566]|uniref:hypothetical protein n=1 Tax=Nocardia sp. CA-129566 TaxID=3239976 RepID=UPI003D97B50E
MRFRPTALGWIDLEVSTAPDWDSAQMHRLARYLGYSLVWPEFSVIPLVDQVRAADVDAVIVPSPEHLHPIMLNALMDVADVETVLPRMSFARWVLHHPAGSLG